MKAYPLSETQIELKMGNGDRVLFSNDIAVAALLYFKGKHSPTMFISSGDLPDSSRDHIHHWRMTKAVQEIGYFIESAFPEFFKQFEILKNQHLPVQKAKPIHVQISELVIQAKTKPVAFDIYDLKNLQEIINETIHYLLMNDVSFDDTDELHCAIDEADDFVGFATQKITAVAGLLDEYAAAKDLDPECTCDPDGDGQTPCAHCIQNNAENEADMRQSNPENDEARHE